MLPITVTQTGTGSSRWVYVSPHMTPTNLAVACVVDGTVTYSVEYAYQDPSGDPSTVPVAPVAVTAFPDATVQGKSDNEVAFMNDPVICWRVTVTAGAGSVSATGLQAGIAGP